MLLSISPTVFCPAFQYHVSFGSSRCDLLSTLSLSRSLFRSLSLSFSLYLSLSLLPFLLDRSISSPSKILFVRNNFLKLSISPWKISFSFFFPPFFILSLSLNFFEKKLDYSEMEKKFEITEPWNSCNLFYFFFFQTIINQLIFLSLNTINDRKK